MVTHVLTAPTTPSMTGSVMRSVRGRPTVDMDVAMDMGLGIVMDMGIVMVMDMDMDMDMGTDRGMDMAMDMGREKQNKQRRTEQLAVTAPGTL